MTTMFGETLLVQIGKTTLLCTVDNDSLCRGCGAPILWVLTPAGRKMPVDPPDEDGTPTVSHFSTCPDASRFRKAKA